MPRGRLRKLLLIGSGLAIAGGGLGGGFWYGAPHLVAQSLRHSGFPQASVEGVYLTPSGVYINHIALDGNDFSSLDQVSVDLSWIEALTQGRARAITVKSIDLTGELDENNNFRLAGWDASTPSSSGSELPFDTLFIQGATLDLDTNEGNFQIKGKLHLGASDKDKKPALNFSVWSEQNQMAFTVNGTGHYESPDSYDLSLELAEGRLDFDTVSLSRLSGWVNATKTGPSSKPVYSGQLSAGKVKLLNTLLQDVNLVLDTSKPEPLFFKTSPAGFPNVSLAARWNATPPEQIELTIDAAKASDLYKMTTATPDPSISAWVDPVHPLMIQLAISPEALSSSAPKEAAWAVQAGPTSSLVRASGTARYDMDANRVDLKLVPSDVDAAKLSALLPLKTQYGIDLTSGTLHPSGEFHIDLSSDPVSVTGPLSVSATKLEGIANNLAFRDGSLSLAMSSLSPWAIDKGGRGQGTFINDQGDIGVASFEFSGSAKSGLAVASSRASLAGGTISASPFTVGGPSANSDFKISLNGIDMSKLAGLVNSPAFTAEGVLNGTVPVSLTPNGIVLKAGGLSSQGEGRFTYSPDQFPPSLQGDDPRMETVRNALKDFHFTVLSLDMDGPMDGHMKTTLKASGTSPVFGDRPIELNLNLEGDLGKLIQNTLQAGDIASTLRSIKDTASKDKK